jgi:hypothetical protein
LVKQNLQEKVKTVSVRLRVMEEGRFWLIHENLSQEFINFLIRKAHCSQPFTLQFFLFLFGSSRSPALCLVSIEVTKKAGFRAYKAKIVIPIPKLAPSKNVSTAVDFILVPPSTRIILRLSKVFLYICRFFKKGQPVSGCFNVFKVKL